ncbi:MAG: hypothetical protein KTR24_02560, partial [Saprospiraceae bacterium]|nr:hypothetical protein [Saprospiraceae bacterium]
MRRIGFAVSAVFIYALSWAQHGSVHFDRPYYFSGEIAFYTFCLTEVEDSITAEIEFGEMDLVENHFVSVLDGCGHGYIRLPYELQSGVYEFSVYVYASQTFDRERVLRLELPIYNPNAIVDTVLQDDASLDLSDLSDSFLTTNSHSSRSAVRCTIPLPPEWQEQGLRASATVRDKGAYAGLRSAWNLDTPAPPEAL